MAEAHTKIRLPRFTLSIWPHFDYHGYMPGRNVFLGNNEFYHVLNRGITSQKVFNSEKNYFQFIDRMNYYRNVSPLMSYAQFFDLPMSIRLNILEEAQASGEQLVEIVAYCLMPNHFHLILKQISNNGISNFVAKLTNSYTRYYNIKHHRLGPILQGRFKAVLVESDEQLIHLSRYIHLNPYSAGLVSTLDELKQFSYSSLANYLFGQKGFCVPNVVLDQFSDRDDYWRFVTDHADYQRSLQVIKALVLES